MPIAYHLIFGTYGFWLPNDPRGSWSKYVGSRRLLQFGHARRPIHVASVADVPHDEQLRRSAKTALSYSPVHLSAAQLELAGNGFAQAVAEGGYRCYACAILPEHVHIVIGDHPRRLSQIVAHWKGRATRQVAAADSTWRRRPLWARGAWRVFIDDERQLANAIAYVESNPLEAGYPRQLWPFVSALELR